MIARGGPVNSGLDWMSVRDSFPPTFSLSFVNQLRFFCVPSLLMELDNLLCVFPANQHSGCYQSKSSGKTGCWPWNSKKGFKVKESSRGVCSPRCLSLLCPSPRLSPSHYTPPLPELLHAPLLISHAHVFGTWGEEVEAGEWDGVAGWGEQGGCNAGK